MTPKDKLVRDIADEGECIEHWVRVEEGKDTPNGLFCTLCLRYGTCKTGCPIWLDTDGAGCGGTPFPAARIAWWNSWGLGHEPTTEQVAAMRAETDYLRELRQKDQERLRRMG